MSDKDLPPEAAVDKAEAAAVRRRWIQLGELVGIAGLIIAALSLWLNWSGERNREAESQHEKAAEASARGHYIASATALNDHQLGLVRDERHVLGEVVVRFPTALGIAEQRPPAQTIDSNVFADALLHATDGGPDNQTGVLPILLSVQFWSDGNEQRSAGLYDIVWRTQGRLLRGRALRLIALRPRRAGGDQAALDAAWSNLHPAN